MNAIRKAMPAGFRFLKKGGRTYRVKVYRPITGCRQMYQCATKLVHQHYLTAMWHAAQLRKKEPDGHFCIYPCEFCDGLHVGHSKRPAELDETFDEWMVSA